MLVDKNYGLNQIGRSHDVRETLQILIDAAKKLDLDITLKVNKPFKFLCHTTLKVPAIDFVVNGKGPNEVISIVSAYAELMERLSALPESWHNREGSLNLRRMPKDRRDLFCRIYDHEYLPGCVEGKHSDFNDIVNIDLLLKNTNFTEKELSLIKNKSVYLRRWAPAKAVFEMDKIYYIPIHLIKLINGTNGLASGRTLTEAVMHGLMEVIERYLLTRIVVDQEQFPTIDLNSIQDKYILDSISYFEQNDIEVLLKDVSTELKIPAVGVITFNKKLSPKDRGYNFLKVGVATNTRHAIMRALTERIQGSTFAEERMLGEISRADEELAFNFLYNSGKTFFNLDYLKEGPITPIKQWIYNSSDEVFIKLQKIISKLNSKVLVVDYTHPILNFPTVQVIVPGISDTVRAFTGKYASLAYLGGVDEQLLALEEATEKLYKTFF